MDGFKAYKYYIAIKLHFTRDSFDVFKNRGVIKGTRDAFYARNDRMMFEKLSRKYPIDRELIQYYVANFAYGNDAVVYSFEEGESNLLEWNRRKQSITKIFSDDCNKIINDACKKKLKNGILNLTLNGFPRIITLYLGNQISIESVRILDDYEGLLESWKQNTSMMLLLESELRRVEKLKGFVKYDKKRIDVVYHEFKEELKELQHG